MNLLPIVFAFAVAATIVWRWARLGWPVRLAGGSLFTALALWICAFAGDLTGDALGRRLGRRFLLEHRPRVHITETRLARVEAFFARYGLATILIGRFVGLVRAIAPFPAGASRYPRGRFAAVAAIGTGLWSATFVLLGLAFWQSFDQAVAIAKQARWRWERWSCSPSL